MRLFHGLASRRRFSATLDEPRLHSRNPNQAPAPPEAASIARMRVLVVDDELNMRKLIATVLQGPALPSSWRAALPKRSIS
jgi:hypothetical protein